MSSSPATVDRPISARRIRHLLGTLIIGSSICACLLLARMWWTHSHRFDWLFGNLLLAWIPLILSLLLRRAAAASVHRGAVAALAVLWFFFFPNAFYLVTDLIHYDEFRSEQFARHYDLLMNVAFAFGGVFLGCISLYLLHLAVRARYGWKFGWAFALVMLLLTSLGIHLGRFERLNSWDLIAKPQKFSRSLEKVVHPKRLPYVAAYTGLFFFFSLALYTFIVSMARVHEREAGDSA